MNNEKLVTGVGWVSSTERNPTIEAVSYCQADMLGYGLRLTYVIEFK
jgi:hypothetical protein